MGGRGGSSSGGSSDNGKGEKGNDNNEKPVPSPTGAKENEVNTKFKNRDEILSISLNPTNRYFSVGTTDDFRVFRTDNFELYHRESK